jgi:pimeloyl-ACP methyl ester carboxylesterase
MSETQYIDFDGHRMAYRVAGEGPAVVVLQLYRRRDPMIHSRALSDLWQVFEVSPVGYGRSDRVPGYAGEALPDQILTVLDHHGVDRFMIWGYSKGGAMAACIARATPRAAALVCAAFALGAIPTDGGMRQMDRRVRPDDSDRTLWTWVKGIDWADELRSMTLPRLFFWGSEDTSVQMAKRLRRMRELFVNEDIDFIEFPGFGHADIGSDEVSTELVFPTVVEWASRRLGPTW